MLLTVVCYDRLLLCTPLFVSGRIRIYRQTGWWVLLSLSGFQSPSWCYWAPFWTPDLGKDMRGPLQWTPILHFISTFLLMDFTLQYWCWIGEPYLKWRILGEYVWFWITLLVSTVAYTALFFWSRGNIEFNNTSWWRFTIQCADLAVELQNDRRHSLTMLLYLLL